MGKLNTREKLRKWKEKKLQNAKNMKSARNLEKNKFDKGDGHCEDILILHEPESSIVREDGPHKITIKLFTTRLRESSQYQPQHNEASGL